MNRNCREKGYAAVMKYLLTSVFQVHMCWYMKAPWKDVLDEFQLHAYRLAWQVLEDFLLLLYLINLANCD